MNVMHRRSAPTLHPRSMLRPAGSVILLLVLVAFAHLPAAEAATVAPPAATPDEAVVFAVQNMGKQYAGACAGARSPQDLGKLCSRFVEACGDYRAYMTGHTFSEFDTWVFVVRTSDGWHVARTEALSLTDSLTDIPWPSAAAAQNCSQGL